MRLTEIKRLLEKSRSNGVYFREESWATEGILPLIYFSKRGNLYLTYAGGGRQSVTPLPFDMLNMLRDKDNLVVWEGSV